MTITFYAKVARIGLMAYVLAPVVPLATAEPTIDFSFNSNLKAVYDAGLRPWRFNPDERAYLKLVDQKLSVIVPGGGRFSMDVEIASFSVLAGYELNSADFISQPMPLVDAATLLKEVAQSLNIDVNVGAGMESFEVKLNQMKQVPLQTMPAPQYWNGGGISGGARTSVTLAPLFGLPGVSPVKGKVMAAIQFNNPGVITRRFDRPLTPPPGYEHLSMEIPPRDPNQKGFPGPNAEIAKDYIRPPADTTQTTAAPLTSAESVAPSTPKPPPAPTQPTKQPANPVWWIVGLIILATGVVFVTRKKKPKP